MFGGNHIALKKGLLILKVMAVLAIGGLYLLSASKVKEDQERMPSSERASALMVSPALLEIAAGEFKGVIADYLLLKSSIFLGGRYETTKGDWEAVYTLFRQSLALDPYFFQTCYYIQAFLPWGARMAKEAVALLEISKTHRYWDWTPGFYIGFDYFYFLKNNLTASRYLMEASEIPNSPSLLPMLGTRLAQKGGQTMAGIVFLKAMYEKAGTETEKKRISLRIKALTDVLTLEKGISEFSSKFDHPPQSLEELVNAGILKKLPENPYKKPYTYENGRIGF